MVVAITEADQSPVKPTEKAQWHTDGWLARNKGYKDQKLFINIIRRLVLDDCLQKSQ